ncbi:flagellar export chaperone FliS [bacterium (Candidatus Blackallbacteria) CG17_big_fil_post_rev_8_21_14_2_50_48_46]|uniref:Flagellar export chaperone FliS n=1 Tax=bacterium (Candidatus Blackallbacteria) CG17_big_fil_post_rev_8_21_14_2_50_48_46 TaxID=2014261 RepID=A0A2M7FZA3_9BACT|nr:MAG: flagellar export chaperone FliS [bacterium (Candidatus Blackallbacteria) CG18_big_fil_WC_8_21_14_2_50_49_26]PIW14736.1 MAG: flagellar export chaperone FliS [bacterium (Candidatus Blackallbacteria) CG17_big_fil_post_rev_8_21_14_2_50_48_46]PIW50838.1 MAG: flagellar export chaperone FliS [bacterium (Candidatus Blackallbacteria) CG13_big_fil_rev_8_21_14_2_50_49_14]
MTETETHQATHSATPMEQYKLAQIETATPERLLVMLYEGAIKFLNLAAQALDEEQLETSHRNILRAEAILLELMSVLDMEVGGELANNLFNLYDYMYRLLVKANIDHAPEPVREVISLLDNLRSAWDEVAGVVGQMRSEGKLDTEPRERHFAG